MRRLWIIIVISLTASGCLFTATEPNSATTTPPVSDMGAQADQGTEPPEDMGEVEDLGSPDLDMGAPEPDMPLPPEDLGSPDMPPPPPDMDCQRRVLENCTAYERLSEAMIDDGCGGMVDCSMAYAYIPPDVTTVGHTAGDGSVRLYLDFEPVYIPAPGATPSDAECGPGATPTYRMEPLAEGELPHFELGQIAGGPTIRPINPHANDETEEIFLGCVTPNGELPEAPLHVAIRLPDVPGNIGPNRTPRVWLRADNYTPDVRLWQGEGEAGVRMLPVYVRGDVEVNNEPSTDPNHVYGDGSPFPAVRFNSFSDFGDEHYHGMRSSQSVTDATPNPVRMGNVQTVIIVARRNPNNDANTPDGRISRDVLLRDGMGNNQLRFSATPTGSRVYQFVPPSTGRTVSSGLVPPTPGSSMHVYTMVRDNVNVRFFQDYDELAGATPIDGNSDFIFLELAGQFAEDGGSESFRGEIGEVLIYEAALPDADIRRIVSYLERKYALTNVQQP